MVNYFMSEIIMTFSIENNHLDKYSFEKCKDALKIFHKRRF